MNILLVHNYYQLSGGEDTVVENEKNLLVNNGHAVVVYSRDNNEIKQMSIFQKLNLPINSIFNIRTYFEIKKIILKEKIDVLHVHNTLHLISPAVYYAAINSGVPVVQTIHNFRLLCPAATFYRNGKICEDCVSKGLKCAIMHKCYRNSLIQTLVCTLGIWIHRKTGVLKKINYITLTEFTRKKLLSLPLIKENVYIKPNFSFEEKENKVTTSEKGYYLFVGRIEEIKGICLLVEAFESMPHMKLKIIGSGTLDEYLRRYIAEKEITNIQILGFVSHEKISEYLKGAKALIMCSQWYETFGMVIVEAYSNKIPVIVGNIGNIRGLVDEGKTGYTFDYNSKESLIKAVMKMEQSDSDMMGELAYDAFCKKYSGKVNYSILMDIYSSVLSSRYRGK